MLLRLSVENFGSIRDRKELSLVPSALQDPTEALIECPAAPGGRLLPVAVVYGPNASGKSNLIEALRWMCSAVLRSHSRGTPEGGIPRTPFALDVRYADMPTKLEADFVVDGVRFQYGFEASNRAFLKEWLYNYPSKRQMLFERDGMSFDFGRALKGRNRVIADLTRSNSLFLSAASQNAHEELLRVSSFFREMINVSDMPHLATPFWGGQEAGLDRRVIDFLSKAGTGVVDYRMSEVKVSPEFKDIVDQLEAVRERLVARGLPVDRPSADKLPSRNLTLELGHKALSGKLVFFDLAQESEGTRRLLRLLGPILKALDEGSLLIVDELNASLHTQACEALLLFFFSHGTNPKGAQLIATTHDTNLLRCSLLRRDQIWFTEKDDDGATDLYPLTDFHTRKGDNLEKGYLQGRYGAVPFAGPLPVSLRGS